CPCRQGLDNHDQQRREAWLPRRRSATNIGLTQRGVGKVQPSPRTYVSAGGGRQSRPPPAERTMLGGTKSLQTSRLRKSYNINFRSDAPALHSAGLLNNRGSPQNRT